MSKARQKLIYILIILVPIGISIKFYNGPGAEWVTGSLSGVIYVLFWCLVLRLIIEGPSNRVIVGIVFVLTCLLECLQLWQSDFFVFLRNTWAGEIMLGSTFSWNDFPYYIIGAFLGTHILNRVQVQTKKRA